MDTKDATAVLVKISGLLMLAFAAFQLPAYFLPYGLAASAPLWERFAEATANLALPVLLGFALWSYPATITNKIISGEANSKVAIGLPDVERLALTVLGLWLIAYGFTDLIYAVASVVIFKRDYNADAEVIGRFAPPIIAACEKLAIGVVFVIGQKGIRRLLSKARREA